MLTLWLFATVFLGLLLFIVRKRFNYWKWRGAPQYHFMVTVRDLLAGTINFGGLAQMAQKIYDDFPESRYCGVYPWSLRVLFIRDPELIKNLAVKNFEHFVDHSFSVDENVDAIKGRILFALRGEKWKDMRAALSPSFTSSNMMMMFGLISNYTKDFVRYFEEHPNETRSLELKDVFSKFSNDVIAATAFGVTCDSMRDPKNKLYRMGEVLSVTKGFRFNFTLFILMFLPRVAKALRLEITLTKPFQSFSTFLKKKIESRRNGIVRLDILHSLLEVQKSRLEFGSGLDSNLESDFAMMEEVTSKKNEKGQLSDIDVIAQLFLFFINGFASVSNQLCFIAYELAVNVDVQEKLQMEIDKTLRECDGTVTYVALTKMKYMDMVIAEGMRKWPILVVTDRVCTKPFTIEPERVGEEPVTLEIGDIIWIPVFPIHRDPKFYPNPERFDPERFGKKSNAKHCPFLSFGIGPRSCIASRFALMEMKLMFFYLLSKFSLVVTDKTPLELEIGKDVLLLTTKNEFWLRLKPRT